MEEEYSIGIVEAISIPKLSFMMGREWYNLDNKIIGEDKTKIQTILTDIHKGDKINVTANDKRFYTKISKIEVSEEHKLDTIGVDAIIKYKGEIWGKCFDKIHSEYHNCVDNKEITNEEIAILMPSVNSLFISVNQSLNRIRNG